MSALATGRPRCARMSSNRDLLKSSCIFSENGSETSTLDILMFALCNASSLEIRLFGADRGTEGGPVVRRRRVV